MFNWSAENASTKFRYICIALDPLGYVKLGYVSLGLDVGFVFDYVILCYIELWICEAFQMSSTSLKTYRTKLVKSFVPITTYKGYKINS